MNRLAPQCVHILLERLLQMDEATLARAVTPVLEGREGDGFHIRWFAIPAIILRHNDRPTD